MRLVLVGTDARPYVLQLVNQPAACHHHRHHHPARYPCQYPARNQDPPDNQDAWDHLDFPDVVDSPDPPDVWDLWDQWDLPEHLAAPDFRRHLLLPVHLSVFITV